MPLRPFVAAAASGMMGGGGGGFGAGGGGGGGGGFGEERAGSTRILTILPEGTLVKEGDVVCELDSSKFRDELDAQIIRWEQARSWLQQAERLLEVSRIALTEYKEGILKQDMQQIDQYIQMCETQSKLAKADLDRAQDLLKRGLFSDTQVRRNELSYQRTQVAMDEALRMKRRLLDFSAPRILRNLEAKIAAVEADLQAQRAAFEKEDQRKRRLEKAIASCTLKAPRTGVLAYVQESNGWGRTENQIREGTTVRENQPIFQIPDPKKLRVRTKVNEAKVSSIYPGMHALVRVDAFADRLLKGVVREVTVIPTQAGGPFSDVKVYFANVEVVEGFDGLSPGMTAQVEFLIDRKDEVTRVPLGSLRWFDGVAFVALPQGKSGHAWKPVRLGAMDSLHAEVVAGLEPGQRVLSDPAELPPPSVDERAAAKAVDVAGLAAGPRSAG
jgi:multidrug resistance efflux pump